MNFIGKSITRILPHTAGLFDDMTGLSLQFMTIVAYSLKCHILLSWRYLPEKVSRPTKFFMVDVLIFESGGGSFPIRKRLCLKSSSSGAGVSDPFRSFVRNVGLYDVAYMFRTSSSLTNSFEPSVHE